MCICACIRVCIYIMCGDCGWVCSHFSLVLFESVGELLHDLLATDVGINNLVAILNFILELEPHAEQSCIRFP